MKKYLTILILCIVLYLPVKSETINAEISVKPEEIMPYKISNLLFGGFLEFVTNVIDSPTGIWAQDLLDRGFDAPDSIWRTSYYWKTYQEGNGDFIYYLIHGGYNKNGTYSQGIITNNVQQGAMGGVYQNVFQDDTVGMDFYVYFRGTIQQNTVYKGVYLYVFDTTMTRILRLYSLGNPDSVNWSKVSVHIPPTKGYNRVSLLIAVHGNGWLEIDEASCMPSNNVKGVRKEHYDLIKQWNPGVLRYPGGGFVIAENSDWKKTIGHIDQRNPLARNERFHRLDFGFDEFLQLCEDLKIEPYITTRLLDTKPDDASNLLEYCNGGENSTWGKKRVQNGHPQPYNVKYWEIGNEEYYSNPNFLKNYIDSYKEMVKKDPTVNYLAGFDLWASEEYFHHMMDSIGQFVNIATNHPTVFTIPFEPASDIELYRSNSSIGDNIYWALKKFEGWLANGGHLPKIKQAATEWGYTYEYWPMSPYDRIVAGGSLGLGIYMSNQLFAFIRLAENMVMTNMTYQMNFIRGGYNQFTNQRSIFGTPSYHVMAMMSNHFGDETYTINVNSPTIQQRSIGGLWNPSNSPWVDAVTTGNNDTLYVYILNKHTDDSALVNINIDNIAQYDSLNVYQLASKNYFDANTFEEPNLIVPKAYRWKKSDSYLFPPHSFTVLAVPRKYKPIDDTSVSLNIDYTIYPNPSNDFINIKINSSNTVQINATIVDLIGNVILSKEFNTTEINNVIDISGILPGVYFLRISGGTEVHNSKFIKI